MPELRDEDIPGSGFAITGYTVSQTLGGEAALARLRQRLRKRGLKLMLDFVPNHTGLDHPWVEEHPEYYIRGTEQDLARAPKNFTWVKRQKGDLLLAHGRDPYFPGWPDTLQLFVPNYRVSVAERLIPASDVSEQISTAGYQASGTSNMKFMMNGALTIGTRDGATIEMAEAAGEENFFLFGLSAGQVAQSRGFYSPQWHYDNDPETRAALELIGSNHFSQHEPDVFGPILDSLLGKGDHYSHLADLKSYSEAHARLGELYADQEGWSRQAILNIAASGTFSSDRTIAEYAKQIWSAEPGVPES